MKPKIIKPTSFVGYLIILLLVLSAFVLGEGIDIKLIQYEPDSTHARIQIQNLESKSIRNVTLILDNSEPYPLVGIISPGNAIVHSRNVPPGIHKVTVLTKEGITETREILFSKSREEIKKEVSLQVNETKQEKALEIKKKEEITLEKKKSNIGKVLFFIILFLLIISAIIFWYIYTKPKTSRPKILPRPIKVTPLTFKEKSHEQIRKAYEERARKRQEILERIMKK